MSIDTEVEQYVEEVLNDESWDEYEDDLREYYEGDLRGFSQFRAEDFLDVDNYGWDYDDGDNCD